MSKRGNSKKALYSMRTGRKRRLVFKVCGQFFEVDVHERVEVFDIVTKKRVPCDQWWQRGRGVSVPLGTTPRYFEMRSDTLERIRGYEGLVSAKPL
jgi:hypothetical protein